MAVAEAEYDALCYRCNVVNSDTAFEQHFRELGIPAVRARVYRQNEMSSYQSAIPGNWSAFGSSRPVAMRGAKLVRRAKSFTDEDGYALPWAAAVVRRFLRLQGFTSFSRKEIEKITFPLLERLGDTRAATCRSVGADGYFARVCFIRGKIFRTNDFNEWKALKHMAVMLQKTRWLDRQAPHDESEAA